MRLSTIWSIPAMTTLDRLRCTRDWAALKTAANLPKRVRYWTTLVEIGKATSSSPNIPAVTLDELLKNLDTPKSLS